MEINSATVFAPRLSEDDNFLTVITRCYDEKRKITDTALVEKAKDAKRKIQQEIQTRAQDTTITISDEKSFDDFKSSGEWKT